MTSKNFEDQLKRWNLEFEQASKEWENKMKNLGIPEKHIRLTLLEVDKLALKYGWVSDWGHLTPAETNDFLKEWSDAKSTEEQEQKISHYFIEYFSYDNFKKIDECITNWIQNPIFYKRMPIFRDCLFALQNSTNSFNPSNLVVPVLISQTDGIMGEMLKQEGWVFSKKERKWVHPENPTKDTPEKCFGNMIKNKRNRFGSTYIGNLIQTNSRYEVIIDGLFQHALHGENLKNPFFISRHKILHGEDIGYGTLENAFKLFLILNYLSEFAVSNLTEPDDSTLVDFRELSSFGNQETK
jgi:hypothetical protein